MRDLILRYDDGLLKVEEKKQEEREERGERREKRRREKKEEEVGWACTINCLLEKNKTIIRKK